MLILLRWLAGFILSLLLLLAVAAVVIPRVVDPNDFREEISQLVQDSTGRELRLSGDLTVSVFPWLGVEAQGLSFAQPSRISGNLLEVASAQLRVKLLPLLSNRVEVDTIVLESPTIRLVTLADGYDSFAELGAGSEPAESSVTESAAGSAPGSDGGTAAIALVVQGIRLSSGHIIIDDRQAGSLTELVDLNLSTGNLLGAELAEVQAAGVLKDTAGGDDTKFDLSALAKIDTQTLGLVVRDLDSQVELGSQTMQIAFAEFDFQQTQEVIIKGLTSEVEGVIPNADAITLGTDELRANLNAQTLLVANLDVSMGDLRAQISDLRVTDFAENMLAKGRVVIPEFNARPLLQRLDPELLPSERTSLSAVSSMFAFEAGLDKTQLTQVRLKLDESNLQGSVSMTNYAAPSYQFDLQLDQINVDNYLPANSDTGGSAEQAATGSEALLVPMAAFKGLNANGRFRAGDIISGGLELEQIDVGIVSSQGNVKITPRAELYQGKLAGKLDFSENAGRAELKINNEIDLVALGDLLMAADVSDQLSGFGSLVLDLLVVEQDGQQSNEGTIKVFAKDGAIKGVDIKRIVDQSYARYQQLKGREPSASQGAAEQNQETKFAELLGTFYLKDSVLTNDDFNLKAPLFRVGGAGTIDLENQTLDYLVRFSVVNSTDGQGGEAFEKLKGITIPIRFSGALTAPNYSLDMQALYKGLFKKEVDTKKAELLEQKYGIEGAEELSTKDVLKQILLNKALNKDRDGKAQERPIEDVGRKPEVDAPANDDVVEDVPASPDTEPEPEKSAKDQLKDDLKKKLLEGLFN